jgi:hypothetical protein
MLGMSVRRSNILLLMPDLEFDASLGLHDHLRDAGIGSDQQAAALEAVRAAVRAMPGAGMIDVEFVGTCSPELRFFHEAEWVTLYRRWSATPMQGGEWEVLRRQVEETISGVLLPR